jgi:hypothetical protein
MRILIRLASACFFVWAVGVSVAVYVRALSREGLILLGLAQDEE